MEISIDGLVLISEHRSIHKTRIVIIKDSVRIADIDSEDLKAAIEALEKSCWRP